MVEATSEIFVWDLPDDAVWVKPYLEALRGGRTEGTACVAAGIHRDTALKWRKRDSANSARHTRAKAEGRHRALDLCRSILVEGAKKGSSWHLARLYALCAPAEWNRIMGRIRTAEPDMKSMHLTDGLTPEKLKDMSDTDLEKLAVELGK